MAPLVGYTVPNEADAGNASQAELHEFDLQQIAAGFNQTGVIGAGCAVTAQGTPDQSVAVAVGEVMIEGARVAVAAGNVAMAAADGTNPRYDLVTVDTAGLKGKVDGTAAANPVKPDVPDNKVVLAEVYRAASDNAIAAAEIIDKRLILRLPPGFEFAVDTKTANQTATATTAATAETIMTLASITFDGTTIVHLEVDARGLLHGSAAATLINVWEDSTDLGVCCRSTGTTIAVHNAIRRTPTSGAKVYTARMWGASAGTSTAEADATRPMFLRCVKVRDV